jgi:HSP20 family protein
MEVIVNLIRRTGLPMARFRPAAIEDQFGRMVENMFEDFFAPAAQAAGLARLSDEDILTPRVNIVETEKTFQVQAELPGIKKEDVKVAIENQRVSIEAESRHEEEKKEGETVVYTERTARKFMRSFMLPSEVDESASDAKLEHGILTLTLPKKQASAAKRLTIQ